MCVRESRHGQGLFAGCELHSGQKLGRLWGRVASGHETFEECVEAARPRASDRLVALQTHAALGRCWALVDVRGCVFEWSNHACEDDDACNVSVSPSGAVTTTRDVERGEELRWDYGAAFWSSS